MLTRSFFVRLEAKPGKEEEVAAFLERGLQLANAETSTPVWFALRLGEGAFAIFDAFRDEAGRQARIGPLAIAEGDWLSIDGEAGAVFAGRLPIVVTRPDDDLAEWRRWKEHAASPASGTAAAAQ